ncbi:MAG: aminopeptidase [bacterium]
MDKKTIIENIFKKNFNIKSNETCLIYVDKIAQEEDLAEHDKLRRTELIDIANDFKNIGSDFANIIYKEYDSLKEHGMEPPLSIWETAFGNEIADFIAENKLWDDIKNKKLNQNEKNLLSEFIKANNNKCVNCVIALPNFSTSHTLFRDLLTKYGNARFASLPLFEDSIFNTALNINPVELAQFTLEINEKLKDASIVNIKSNNGTDIIFYIRENGFMADAGLLDKPGAFSNLPAGEVYTAPIEGKTEGKFVMEYSPTRKLDEPLTIFIEKGTVKHIEGNDKFKDHIMSAIKNNYLVSNIAELGIGTNKSAKNFLNILEAEKIYGTIHMALGDNSSFGGSVRVNFHEDFILFNPDITVTTQSGKIFKL